VTDHVLIWGDLLNMRSVENQSGHWLNKPRPISVHRLIGANQMETDSAKRGDSFGD
jgi:hypothetical protein